MNMIERGKAVMVAAFAALFLGGPAMAATPGTIPDLTPISDAVSEGVTAGIGVLLAIAPIVIAFAVVWGIINKARRMAK